MKSKQTNKNAKSKKKKKNHKVLKMTWWPDQSPTSRTDLVLTTLRRRLLAGW